MTEITAEHLELATDIARKMSARLDPAEVESAALQGLIDAAAYTGAIANFDKFAARCIRNRIKMAIRAEETRRRNLPTVSVASVVGTKDEPGSAYYVPDAPPPFKSRAHAHLWFHMRNVHAPARFRGKHRREAPEYGYTSYLRIPDREHEQTVYVGEGKSAHTVTLPPRRVNARGIAFIPRYGRMEIPTFRFVNWETA